MFYKFHGVRVLIYHDNKLLILKRAGSDKNDASLWDVPGGKIESSESLDDAIKREVYEETGISESSILIDDLYGLIFDDFDSTSKLVIAVYICQSKTTDICLNLEHSEYKWIDPKNLSSYNLGRVLRSIKSYI